MHCIQDYYIAQGAVVSGDVILSPGVNIWYVSVVRGDLARITLGPRVNLQDGCIVHTDYDAPQDIEEGVVVGHGAILHSCTVRRGALVGMNSVVMDDADIGEEAFVAANSFVRAGMKIAPPRSVVASTEATQPSATVRCNPAPINRLPSARPSGIL